MHIPSRGEVLSWNENQVADLLREHKLLDCVDCIYQRHINGQKLLQLKENDVLYFLEIHDKRSRGKFWNVVRQITEKKGGVQKLMNKFQADTQWNTADSVNEEEQSSESDDDSFESDYDEPDEEHQSSISLERQETIKKNLLANFKSQVAPREVHHDEDYPESEDIYDVPEDGCGEPDEDMYDVPSDESGGGVVRRHAALERKESEQYLIPDNTKLLQLAQTPDEEDYEDLGGAPPPGRAEDFDTQEEYVVPDLKPQAVTPAPPRPPKAAGNSKPLPPPVANGHKEPPKAKNGIKNLQSMFEHKNKPKPPAQPPKKNTKVEKKPPEDPVEPEQEDYEFPDYHPPASSKKPALKPPPVSSAKKSSVQTPPPPVKKPSGNKKVPVEPEQETYEPPDQPPRPNKLPSNKPPVNKQHINKPPVNKQPFNKSTVNKTVPAIPDQETYEPPDQPPRPAKKSPYLNRPPAEFVQEDYVAPEAPSRPTPKKPPHLPVPEQENYEPPELQRSTKPAVPMDTEENYEAPEGMVEPEIEQEDYEVPDKPDEAPVKEVPEETTKKSPFKSLFNRSPSKKVNPNIPKPDKKKTKNEVPPSPPKPSPAVPEKKPAPSRSPPIPKGKNAPPLTQPEHRRSMALPNLPTDKVDTKPKGPSDSPKLPPKPIGSKEKPVHTSRSQPELPKSNFPKKSKEQLLQHQPWFHGTISKSQVSNILKSTKKDGAYLVRASSRDPGQCTMSILYKNDIRHLNIPCDSNGHYRLGDSGVERFKNIEELVSYFNKHDVEFSAGGKTPLTHACLKS